MGERRPHSPALCSGVVGVLLLVRHALTDSTGKRLTGWQPGVHLSVRGQQQAEAGLRSAQTAPEQVAAMRARAESAQARVKQTQAALAQAELNLQYTTIRAPVNGVVSKRTVELGEVIQAGQPLVAEVNLDDIWVTANYKETQLKYMRAGQLATIHVDTTGRDYKGHVDSFGGATGARQTA